MIGAPKRDVSGEARVAMTPAVGAMQIAEARHAPDRGRARATAGYYRPAYEAAGVNSGETAAALWKRPTSSPRCASLSTTELKRLSADKVSDIVLLSRPERGAAGSRERSTSPTVVAMRHGAPDQPGTENGYAVVRWPTSQANRAVIEAASRLRALLQPARSPPPERCRPRGARYVGAGVAGLAAIGHLDLARGDHLCLRRASPKWPSRIESMGAEFVFLEFDERIAGQFGARRLRRARRAPEFPAKSSSRSSASSRPTSISHQPRRSFRAAPHRCLDEETWSRR